MSAVLTIIDAHGTAWLAEVRALFREYAGWLGVDLCFQGFEEELATLPGRYAPPAGCLLLVRAGDDTAGCVAMRALEPGVCEMKRLWVRPSFRGSGAGAHLVRTVMERAAAAGYERMRLDTLAQMQSARRLYRAFGFVEIAPYYGNPLEGVVYLEARLR